MNKINVNEIIKGKLQEVDKFLNVELDADSESLQEQITLGKKWDNPYALSKAMDMHPAYYAQWAYMLKSLKQQEDKVQAVYDVWLSTKRTKLRKKIIDDRIKNGSTKKQAVQGVTQQMVEDKFNVIYNYDNEIFIKYRKPLDEIKNEVAKVQIIVDAFKQRKDLLVVLGYLVRSLVDNNMLVINKHKNKTKERNEQG